jgi:hypothetical protein
VVGVICRDPPGRCELCSRHLGRAAENWHFHNVAVSGFLRLLRSLHTSAYGSFSKDIFSQVYSFIAESGTLYGILVRIRQDLENWRRLGNRKNVQARVTNYTDAFEQIARLADLRNLLERAVSKEHNFAEKAMPISDNMYEYGSIVSTQTSPSGAPSHLHAATPDDDSPEPVYISSSASNSVVCGDLAPDFNISSYPETLGIDEEFWKMNESLLNHQFLETFTMDNGSGMFGDDYDIYIGNC